MSLRVLRTTFIFQRYNVQSILVILCRRIYNIQEKRRLVRSMVYKQAYNKLRELYVDLGIDWYVYNPTRRELAQTTIVYCACQHTSVWHTHVRNKHAQLHSPCRRLLYRYGAAAQRTDSLIIQERLACANRVCKPTSKYPYEHTHVLTCVLYVRLHGKWCLAASRNQLINRDATFFYFRCFYFLFFTTTNFTVANTTTD